MINPNTLKALANTTAWQTVRDEYFIPAINEIKDVTKPIKVQEGLTVSADSVILSKTLAVEVLIDLINGIDKFIGNGSNKVDDRFN